MADKVVGEALRALARIHPDADEERLRARFRSMNQWFEGSCVEGWEPLELGIVLPDPNDRHVVAAALRGRAEVIVTDNIQDFPSEVLAPLGLEALRLDDFLLDLHDLNPFVACQVVSEQAAAMARPPVQVSELLDRLTRSGARGFARAVRESLGR